MAAKAEHRFWLALTDAGLQPAAPSILVQREAAGWSLPVVEFPAGRDFDALASYLCQQASERLTLAASVLLYLDYRKSPDTDLVEAVVAMDVHRPPIGLPAGFEWFPLDASLTANASTPEHSAPLVGWAEELASDRPAQRVPWSRPGWYLPACAWIESELRAAGLTPTGPVEQMRAWSLSCLLRVPTDAGSIYFKALPQMFAREPRRTQALAARFPGQIPAVLALDESQRWLLTRDFGGTQLHGSKDTDLWSQALTGYARLQIETRHHLEEWLALGCPDRRLSVLAGQIEPMLADRESLLPDQPRGLTEPEIAEMLTLVEPLQRACAELRDLGLPYTLEHGDLHAGNIAVVPGGFVYYDWTDGCLAHPFICLPTYLENAPGALHEALCHAYLSQWSAFANPDRLDRALALARPLSALHIAVSYHDIRLATEPRRHGELLGAQTYFLKEVLKYKGALFAA